MSIQPIQFREQIIKTVREYFCGQDFREVTVPLLQESVPLEPNIYPFPVIETVQGKQKTLYRPTSPESVLKKFLHKTPKNCFAVSPTFRNLEEPSPIRSPGFTMAEWYRTNSSTDEIMDDVQKLIGFVSKQIPHCRPERQRSLPARLAKARVKRADRQGSNASALSADKEAFLEINDNPWPKIPMDELFQKHLGISLKRLINNCHSDPPAGGEESRCNSELLKLAVQKDYQTKGASWEQLFNQLFLNEIEPHLEKTPLFITDYPSIISPLCKPKNNNPDIADRFELYINGIEIANGNAESSDADSVRRLFLEEQTFRQKNSLPCPPLDNDFLASLINLEQHRVCGVGLGVDRLAMVLSGADNIGRFNLGKPT